MDWLEQQDDIMEMKEAKNRRKNQPEKGAVNSADNRD